jgi:hypothetical protein
MRPVVLVHGTWHGAWCFERVAARLCAKDYKYTCLPRPRWESALICSARGVSGYACDAWSR